MWRVPVIVMVLAATAVPVGFRLPVHFSFGFDDPLDAIENVLGYIPVGIALGSLSPLRAVFAAAGMSLFAETFQTVMQHRDPTVSDLITNVIGAIIGKAIRSRWAIHSPGLPVNRKTSLIAATGAVALLLIVSISSGAPVNLRGVTVPGTLESYWKLDEHSGRIALDSSDHGLNGKFRYEPLRSSGGKGAGTQFDGKKDSVDFGKATAFRLNGSMAISAWIYPTTFPVDDAAIVSNRDRDELGYQLDVTQDRGPRTIGFKLADPCGHLMARYGKTVLETDVWYYVTGVYDAEARTLDVYLNGVLDNGPLVGSVAGRQRSARGALYVGKRSGSDEYEFAGSIRNVRIYSIALTKEEIVSDMDGISGSATSAKQIPFAALPKTSDTKCSETSDREDARIPGAIAAFGVLVAIVCIGLWPTASPFFYALVSFAAGFAFLPVVSSTMPTVILWTMPFISLAGGVSVAVSTRNRLPVPDLLAPQP